eukprot:PhF_6_TR11717/c0_g2_i6/m.19110
MSRRSSDHSSTTQSVIVPPHPNVQVLFSPSAISTMDSPGRAVPPIAASAAAAGVAVQSLPVTYPVVSISPLPFRAYLEMSSAMVHICVGFALGIIQVLSTSSLSTLNAIRLFICFGCLVLPSGCLLLFSNKTNSQSFVAYFSAVVLCLASSTTVVLYDAICCGAYILFTLVSTSMATRNSTLATLMLSSAGVAGLVLWSINYGFQKNIRFLGVERESSFDNVFGISSAIGVVLLLGIESVKELERRILHLYRQDTESFYVGVLKLVGVMDSDAIRKLADSDPNIPMLTTNALFSTVIAIEKYRAMLPNYVLDQTTMSDTVSNTSLRDANTDVPELMTPLSSINSISPVDHLNRSADITNNLSEVYVQTGISFALIETIFVGASEDWQKSHTNFINHTHSLATSSCAALHSFVGDRVVASWNAARKVHQHPVKGALFLAWIHKNTGDVFIKSYGAVCSGPGFVLCGGRRQTLLVHLPWREKLVAMHRLAVENKSSVVCQETYDHSYCHVESRWVDALGYGVDSVANVFEVLDELSTNDEEWMYTLSDNNVPNDPYSKATAACVKGNYGEAMSILTSLHSPRKSVLITPLVVRLEQKASKALRMNVPSQLFPFITVDNGPRGEDF